MNWLPINFELIRNPYNWLIIALMVVIIGLSVHLIFSAHPAADPQAN